MDSFYIEKIESKRTFYKMTFIQRKLKAKGLFKSENERLKDFYIEKIDSKKTFYKR